MQQTNRNKGKEFIIPEYKLLDLGGFAFTQKKMRKFSLAAGLRVERRMLNTKKLLLDSLGSRAPADDIHAITKFNSLLKKFEGYAGSIGLSYLADSNSTIKLNFSRGFRAPNIAELTSNGKHEGTLRYEYGNTQLSSETSFQIDFGYFLNTDHITLEVTPFINFISNYIYVEKIKSITGGDSIPDINDPRPAFKFIQGNARILGGEIYFDFHPHPLDWLHIEQSFNYVEAIQNNQSDSSKYLPFTPAPRYRCEIRANFLNKGDWISNCYFKIGVDHYFAQNKIFSAFGTETTTPQYTLLSAGIGSNINAFNQKDLISIFLSGENLTDVSYQSHLSRLKYTPINPLTGRSGVFNMGRNISLKIILRI
jgi:iron complex outermembrane receptor protein